jgi:hypothetical protein
VHGRGVRRLTPLVSCICPTTPARAEFMRDAICSFLGQAYPYLEWIAVDGSATVGAKRNEACDRARGQIICHFDDDDVSRTGRVLDQVTRLMVSGKQVTGYHSLTFRELRPVRVLTDDGWRATSGWWRWRDKDGLAAGTSLCYWRDWWRTHPFKDHNTAQDDWFWADAISAGVAIAADGHDMICATNHYGCVSGRMIGGSEWEELKGDPYVFC